MADSDQRSDLTRAGSRDGVAASPEDHRLLRSYVQLNLVVLLVAALWLVALRIWFVHNDWIGALLVLLAVLSGCLFRAIREVDRKRYVPAVTTIAVANWVMIVVFATLVPFTVVILPLAILTPCLLALPFVTPAQFSVLAGGAVLAGGLMAAAGHLQGGVGLEAEAPGWALDALVILFIPLLAGLILRLAWQAHRSLVARANALVEAGGRIVAAGDRERRRIERALHDGTLRGLHSASARLGDALLALDREPANAEARLEGVIRDLQDASSQLRELSHGIYPSQLTDQGLLPALQSAASRSKVRATVRAEGITRYTADVEASIYFCCIAALHSANEHAGQDSQITIILRGRDGISLTIHDNSDTGPNREALAKDLVELGDRVLAVGGTFEVENSSGSGVQLTARITAAALGETPNAVATPFHLLGATVLRKLWRLTAIPVRSPALLLDPRQPVSERVLNTHRSIAAQVLPISLTVLALPSFYLMNGGPRVLVGGLVNLGALIATLTSLALARHEQERAALVLMAGTLWSCSMVMTALFPITMNHISCLMVLPVLMAVPHVGQRFQVFVWVTVATTVVVVVIGRLQPFGSGIPEETPLWVVNFEEIDFVVLSLVICLFVVSIHHVTLVEHTADLRQVRRRMVDGMNTERRRLERDLHDGAQQRLVAAAVRLRVAQRLLRSQPDHVRATLQNVMAGLREAEQELTDLSTGLSPPNLAEKGLQAALEAAARRSPLATTVEAEGIPRYPPEVEVGIYFSCLEALQNAAKHAGDEAEVTITLRQDDGLVLDVSDTGHGIDPGSTPSGQGLTNIQDRLAAMGGTLRIESKAGAGVHLHARIPLPRPTPALHPKAMS